MSRPGSSNTLLSDMGSISDAATPLKIFCGSISLFEDKSKSSGLWPKCRSLSLPRLPGGKAPETSKTWKIKSEKRGHVTAFQLEIVGVICTVLFLWSQI